LTLTIQLPTNLFAQLAGGAAIAEVTAEKANPTDSSNDSFFIDWLVLIRSVEDETRVETPAKVFFADSYGVELQGRNDEVIE
jgi:hypothetical protein